MTTPENDQRARPKAEEEEPPTVRINKSEPPPPEGEILGNGAVGAAIGGLLGGAGGAAIGGALGLTGGALRDGGKKRRGFWY